MSAEEEIVEQEEVQLSGKLAEFRTALQEEIEASRRNASSNAVPLINGRRIAQVGASFQYVFDVENVLNLPGDTPGDLYIQGRSPLEVIIISIDGMTITLSISIDLGPFVPSARLQSNLAHLMRKLIKRIEALANVANPAGERILGNIEITGSTNSVNLPGLNPEQQQAVRSSLGRNATFIWGPPGTGKSRTIGSIGEHLYRRGRSVLLVSHTNVAVDQAIMYIGEALDSEQLAKGQVLRVGEPKDKRLFDFPDLLLETHVTRRSEELTKRRDALESDCVEVSAKVKKLSRQIDICEWLSVAERDLIAMAEELEELERVEANLEEVQTKHYRLVDLSEFWFLANKDAETAQKRQARLSKINEEIEKANAHIVQLQEQLESNISNLSGAEKLLAKAEAIEPHRTRLSKLPSLEEQGSRKKRASAEAAKAQKSYEAIKAKLAESEKLYVETTSVGFLMRRWRKLPSPETQKRIVEQLRPELQVSKQKWDDTTTTLLAAIKLFEEVAELTNQLQPYANVPRVQIQRDVVRNLKKKINFGQKEISNQKIYLEASQEAQAETITGLEEFKEKYSALPEEVLAQYAEYQEETKYTKAQIESLQRQYAAHSQELNQLVSSRLLALREMGLTVEGRGPIRKMFDAIRAAYQKAQTEMEGADVENLKSERSELNDRIRTFQTEIREIEDALKKVEELVISEAIIVATTLTRAYLRDSIQNRRFDTVILDEASMAPIPALYVAASRADANAVVVGDFKQLPPIVLSDHDIAKKWLGTDIFDKAGLSNPNVPFPYFIKLCEQFRMHPDISAIPNTLVYDNILKDGPETEKDDSLDGWYRKDWGYDNPVLLVDTGSVGAWVTSVARGRGSSRLNFLSATICVELVEQLLRKNRPKLQEGERPRALLVCPYRPHAKLLSLLLREEGLDGEVIAGTAHNFQGSEADVVILDLVCDEPHWRVGMFIPDLDPTTIRLLNVALTRAKRRLIVVGDFDYISKRAKRAFIGAKLIPFLRSRYPSVDAKDIVPAGLAAKAAKAQSKVLGGEVEPDADRIVVTHEHFYPILRGDLDRAKSRIVVFSAFITTNRLGQIEPQFRAALERGVKIYIVTKAHSNRKKSELPGYRMLEKTLSDWGIAVIHKQGMHEKLIFIDDGILWSGSLNPLSFSNTQEVMERRANQKVVHDFARTLRLEELLGEYKAGSPSCPYCGSEVVASEGNHEPYFWRCVENNCYTRSIDEPTIEGGIVVCTKCGGAVECGEWGGKPAWRCLENRRHHQKIARTHLRLPKMREVIPKRELRKLDKYFGIDQAQINKKSIPRQRSLFDLVQ